MKDELEHTCSGVMWTETRCKTCDQRLSYTASLNGQYDEEHVFDSVADLICDLCGYGKEAPEEVPTPEPTPEVTPEPTGTPAPTKKPEGGSSGSDSGSGSSGGTKPSKPRETATPTPEELLPKTGDGSLPVSFLLLTMAISLSGIVLLKKRRQH